MVVGQNGQRSTRLKQWALLTPFFICVIAFLCVPAIAVILNSFRMEDGTPSLHNYVELFTSDFYIQSFQNSFLISVMSALIGLAVALISSYALYNVRDRLGRVALMVTNMTSNFAGVPLAFAFMIIMGNNGVFTVLFKLSGLPVFESFSIYSFWGLMMMYVYFQVPLGILLLYPAFDRIEACFVDAAISMGASPRYFWRYVGIPLLLPALLSTLAILFANAMGAYATAYALTNGGYNLIPIRIGTLVSGDLYLKPNMASALSVVLAMILFAMNLISRGKFYEKK